jgi:hypothetical protein
MFLVRVQRDDDNGARMPKVEPFPETFAALKGLLEAHAKRVIVTVDKPGHYQVASPTLKDRLGRPLVFAAVKANKSTVSYHLMPLYGNKALRAKMSPTLQKRMNGMACLNFTTIEPAQFKELAAITKEGIAGFKNVKLPWA